MRVTFIYIYIYIFFSFSLSSYTPGGREVVRWTTLISVGQDRRLRARRLRLSKSMRGISIILNVWILLILKSRVFILNFLPPSRLEVKCFFFPLFYISIDVGGFYRGEVSWLRLLDRLGCRLPLLNSPLWPFCGVSMRMLIGLLRVLALRRTLYLYAF